MMWPAAQGTTKQNKIHRIDFDHFGSVPDHFYCGAQVRRFFYLVNFFSSAGAVAEEAAVLAGSNIPGNFAGPRCAGFS